MTENIGSLLREINDILKETDASLVYRWESGSYVLSFHDYKEGVHISINYISTDDDLYNILLLLKHVMYKKVKK